MCYDYMRYDDFDDAAACDEQAGCLEPYAVIEAEYMPPGTLPDWATVFLGVRSLWLVDGDTAHMAPYGLPSVSKPARWVPLEHLRKIIPAWSLLDDLH